MQGNYSILIWVCVAGLSVLLEEWVCKSLKYSNLTSSVKGLA